ncbi:hypothetical protein F0562_010690 [Nyssa sinensis]|uniref:Reverse transcriptase Ty1/copia-type domain-containing protein n=1 Tax=Nyssa sinensis TaxID=561372 RepID=A0A5J5A4P7_9ASTE|nr:hypothetical protein F0562_010690 [Nyssa sinensis]
MYISRHVLFDETTTKVLAVSSTKAHSPLTELTHAPLFFNAQAMLVPSPSLYAPLSSTTPPKSVSAVDAFPQTICHSIQLTNSGPPALITYSDTNWAGNLDDCTSTSTYISFLGSNQISWSSKKQRAVARSFTEAEYWALANAASETIWLLGLFHELGFPLKATPLLLCDNLGATHLSFNPVQHSRMKHIQIDLHFVRDLVQRGTLQVRHVHTQDQLVDLLTKPLSLAPTDRTIETQDWSCRWKLNLARAYKDGSQESRATHNRAHLSYNQANYNQAKSSLSTL